ncbi:Sulfite oxidase [Hypsibius exemplaris]|uniref:Sulfite oxidase n=1 Tax=Hypsibius exemplaris TaxID=2072580 RepID=A0A1W0WFL8_HYPEX|nr:Sulfite oxidase [Hypsibius exemplaris]
MPEVKVEELKVEEVKVEEVKVEKEKLLGDYSKEPQRWPLFVVNAEQPFNAETPPQELVKEFFTPTEKFYVRSHGPAPDLNAGQFCFHIGGLVDPPKAMTMQDLQALAPKVTVDAVLMCAGNRRNELKAVKPVKGVGWELGAIGNGSWGGVPLREVLRHCKVDLDSPHLHVEFVGVEDCEEKTKYGSSIPMCKAADPKGDVLLAWEMNGKPLTRDHGYPLRVVVPGYIGARSVKWLKHINILDRESVYFFQSRDYKLFIPSVGWDTVEELWDLAPALAELAVQSAICEPLANQVIPTGTAATVKGYALSNGHRITRVDVSLDDGANWQVAEILHQDSREKKGFESRYWSWSLWQLRVDKFPSPCTVVCRAWDIASNTQPENAKNIWNLRGVMNNAWHRVKVSA